MLPRAFAERTGRPPPSYRRCYFAALDGALPALQHGGRWFVADEDLDAAAVALGMVERSEPAPERPAEACGRVGSDHDGGRMAARTARKVMERRGGGA
jgi:hypothetical protein